jgi:hypothetical protein
LKFFRERAIAKEYFICQELSQTMTGSEIFELFNENVRKHKKTKNNCICTNGAPAM